jgi:hypothetical protein
MSIATSHYGGDQDDELDKRKTADGDDEPEIINLKRQTTPPEETQ